MAHNAGPCSRLPQLAQSIFRVASTLLKITTLTNWKCCELRKGRMAWEKHEFLFFPSPPELVLWKGGGVRSTDVHQLEALLHIIGNHHQLHDTAYQCYFRTSYRTVSKYCVLCVGVSCCFELTRGRLIWSSDIIRSFHLCNYLLIYLFTSNSHDYGPGVKF